MWFVVVGVILWAYISYRNGDFSSKSERTGKIGEDLIVKALRKLVGRDRVFKNVYLDNYGYGKTELDVVMVDNTGIYVIESKNYNGIVGGNVSDSHWEYKHVSGNKYKFYNPIKQNETHMKAVIREFGLDREDVVMSYIVFGGNTEIGKIHGKKNARILRLEYLADVIYKDRMNRKRVFNNHEVKEISRRLKECSKVSLYEKWRHKESVKRKSVA